MNRFEARKREGRNRPERDGNIVRENREAGTGYLGGFEDVSIRVNNINMAKNKDRLDGFGRIAPPTRISLSADEVLKQCGRDMCRLKAGIMQVRKDESETYYQMFRVQTTVNHVLADKLDHLHRKLKTVMLTPCARCGFVPENQGPVKHKRPTGSGAHRTGATDSGQEKVPEKPYETVESLRDIARRRPSRSTPVIRAAAASSGQEQPSPGPRTALSEAMHSCHPSQALTSAQSQEGYRIPKIRRPNPTEGDARGQVHRAGLWREPASLCHSETECEGSPRPDDTESETDSALEDPRSARARARRAGMARTASIQVPEKSAPLLPKTGEELARAKQELTNARLMSLSLRDPRRRIIQPVSTEIVSATIARRQEVEQGSTSQSDGVDVDAATTVPVRSTSGNRSPYTGVCAAIPLERQPQESGRKELDTRRVATRRSNPYGTQGNLILLSEPSRTREQNSGLRFWNSVAKGSGGRMHPPGLEE